MFPHHIHLVDETGQLQLDQDRPSWQEYFSTPLEVRGTLGIVSQKRKEMTQNQEASQGQGMQQQEGMQDAQGNDPRGAIIAELKKRGKI